MDEKNTQENAIAVTSTVDPGVSYLEWGAVLGGATIAGAMSVVLFQFGAGVGLAIGTPTLADNSASWNVLAAGLWIALVALTGSSAGGYIAGRMRSRRGDAMEAEVEFRDGVHGLVVWALSTLIVGLSMAFATILSAVGDIAAVAAPTAEMLRITGNVSIIFTFAAAAGAALGAAAAWYAAEFGGRHRDDGLSIHEIVPKVFRRKTAS